MTQIAKPAVKPADPRFSSGPTKKRPGWSLEALNAAALGRSHRSGLAKNKLKEAIDRTRAVLEVPANFKIAIVPASDTGAVEMAMWSMLGPRPVDVLHWESFSKDWATDAAKQLKLKDLQILEAPRYGVLPDLSKVRPGADIIFPWNGTTSGVRVPDADWIPDDRGIVICDATSACFAMPIDWSRLDVVTFSWQKVMGSEAAHGMLMINERAIERLTDGHQTPPLPKIFRMTKDGKLDEALFEGNVINTPSMLAVEDYLDALEWGAGVGGLEGLTARADAAAKAVYDWIERTPWARPLAEDPATRTNTGVCIAFADPAVASLADEAAQDFQKRFIKLLENEGVGYDLGAYRTAPAGLRIWCGSTVEASDVEKLLPWLDWAYAETLAATGLA